MIVASGTVFVATVIATGLVLILLRRYAVFDRPNARSSHTELTSRGGGIAVTAVLLTAWCVLAPPEQRNEIYTVAALAGLLAAVSWIDDLRSLSPLVRLASQLIAVLAAGYFLAGKPAVFHDLIPRALDLAVAGLLWIWFINLFNFMDGIDGISGVEAASIGAGIVLISLVGPHAPDTAPLAAAAAAAALGFLCWNWHPAKLFLGDVGSVPLGFLLGWLLIDLATAGQWAAALILPLYYLTDATVTLLRRARRGEKVWQAHREHFYQRAVQAGRSHAAVSAAVAGCNAILIGFAVISITWPWAALGASVVFMVCFLYWLSR